MAEVFTAEELRKQDRKLAFSVYGKSLISLLLGLILFLSLGLISTVNQKQLGYRVYTEPNGASGVSRLFDSSYNRYDDYRLSEDGKTATLYKSYVYDTDRHDFVYSAELTEQTKTAAPVFDKEAADKKISDGDHSFSYSATYVEKTTLRTVMDILSQIFMLVLLFVLVYAVTWQQGDKDHNFEDFGRMQADQYRGLRVGLLASIPTGLMTLGLLFSRLTGLLPNFIFWYRLGMLQFAPINNALSAGTSWTCHVTWWILPVAVLCWATLPLIAHIGYRFGYKRYSIGEHFIYKNVNKK